MIPTRSSKTYRQKQSSVDVNIGVTGIVPPTIPQQDKANLEERQVKSMTPLKPSSYHSTNAQSGADVVLLVLSLWYRR